MVSRFSHSSLGLYRQCPKKFEFQYISKVEVPRRFYAHFHLGTSVHRQLKIAYDRAAVGVLYPLEEMLENYRAEWSSPAGRRAVPAQEYMTVEEYAALGEKMLVTFYEKYQPFDQARLTMTEKTLDFHLPNCPVGFRAKLDRVLRLDEHRYEICDYKTGANIVQGGTDPGFRNQMGMYQLAFEKVYPSAEDDPERKIELVQHFLRQDEQVRYRMRPDELEELEEQFRSQVAEIMFAERTGEWQTKVGWHCNYCDFATVCPAQRHRKMLEAEEAGDADEAVEISATQASKLAEEFLQLHIREKAIGAEKGAIKDQLIEAARKLNLTRLVAESGHVTVSLKEKTGLPTKMKDGDKLAALSAQVRDWQKDKDDPILVEPFFELSKTALMDSYKKGRLGEARSRQVEEYLVTSESPRVTPTVRKVEDSED